MCKLVTPKKRFTFETGGKKKTKKKPRVTLKNFVKTVCVRVGERDRERERERDKERERKRRTWLNKFN